MASLPLMEVTFPVAITLSILPFISALGTLPAVLHKYQFRCVARVQIEALTELGQFAHCHRTIGPGRTLE